MNISKKTYTVIIIFVLIFLFNIFKNTPLENYKILKVINTDEFYIDYNHNKKAEKNELVKLYGINGFKNTKNSETINQGIKTNLSPEEVLILGIDAQIFSEKTFTNKYVKTETIYPKVNDQIPQVKIYLNNNDIAKTLLNNGFATSTEKEYTDKVNYKKITERKQNIKYNNYVILNLNNNIFHNISCPYAKKIKRAKVYNKTNLPSNAQPCQNCALQQQETKTEFEIKDFNFKTETLNFYFTDFNKNTKPDNACKNEACKALLKEINNAKQSIDFAIYGYANQPEILNALISARNRGINIRWVTDANSKNQNIYKEISSLQKILTNYKTDNLLNTNSTDTKYINAIMHNKFFIFDNEKIWVGSANISQTDLADFNSNTIMLANSKVLANIYLQEFEQMYNGKFHNLKNKIPNKEKIKIEEEIFASVYFSPTDDIIPTQIIPHINNAKKYIYISSFIITHNEIKKALIEAQKKGIEIKIITDATSANGKYSIHNELRKNYIKTKVENKAGKMHSKTIIIDDKYTIFGSMNLTKSGTTKNDENIIIIQSTFITKKFKNQFIYLWNSIPEKWANKTPLAESPESKGSCSDGIDNDFDGLIDKEDTSCTIN